MLDNLFLEKKNLSHHKKKCKIIKTDISKNEELDRYFKGADYVFHLAGLAEIIPSIKNPKKYFINNVLGTLNVLEAAKKQKLKNLFMQHLLVVMVHLKNSQLLKKVKLI